MSSMPVNQIEPQDLPHEASQAINDILYLTRRYRAILRRMGISDPYTAQREIAFMVARLEIKAEDLNE